MRSLFDCRCNLPSFVGANALQLSVRSGLSVVGAIALRPSVQSAFVCRCDRSSTVGAIWTIGCRCNRHYRSSVRSYYRLSVPGPAEADPHDRAALGENQRRRSEFVADTPTRATKSVSARWSAGVSSIGNPAPRRGWSAPLLRRAAGWIHFRLYGVRRTVVTAREKRGSIPRPGEVERVVVQHEPQRQVTNSGQWKRLALTTSRAGAPLGHCGSREYGSRGGRPGKNAWNTRLSSGDAPFESSGVRRTHTSVVSCSSQYRRRLHATALAPSPSRRLAPGRGRSTTTEPVQQSFSGSCGLYYRVSIRTHRDDSRQSRLKPAPTIGIHRPVSDIALTIAAGSHRPAKKPRTDD